MPLQIQHEPRDPGDFPNWRFPTLDFDYDAATRSAWMSFKAEGPSCFTMQTLKDLKDLGSSLRRYFVEGAVQDRPIHFVALASKKPGVFNLGGDLAVFIDAIRSGEGDALKRYAYACIDVLHAAASGYELPIIVVAVISGQAYGGGLEAALAHDFIFAEEDAMLGVPEVAFNTFPGMGAVTLMTRRIGAALTEKVISGGKSYSAQDMLGFGIIDRVTPAGKSIETVRAWMMEGGEELRARRLAIVQARRRCLPVSRDELIRIVDVWTDCASGIGEHDLRYMERLVAAQTRMRRIEGQTTR